MNAAVVSDPGFHSQDSGLASSVFSVVFGSVLLGARFVFRSQTLIYERLWRGHEMLALSRSPGFRNLSHELQNFRRSFCRPGSVRTACLVVNVVFTALRTPTILPRNVLVLQSVWRERFTVDMGHRHLIQASCHEPKNKPACPSNNWMSW